MIEISTSRSQTDQRVQRRLLASCRRPACRRSSGVAENKARPTTSMPVIAPTLKATASAGAMPPRAASADALLARTETFMPMKPAAPD
jgi:hypothetical protein